MTRKTIREIKAWLAERETISEAELLQLEADSRSGVRRLAQSYRKRMERLLKERARVEKMWHYEQQARKQGYQVIAGVDEAGRGPIAGPVVAAAVILPKDFDAAGLNDSKQLSMEKRQQLRIRIEQEAVSIGIGIVDAERIDQVNILQATYQAMRLALTHLAPRPDHILIDAITLPQIGTSQQAIVKGDSLSHSIAAASIIAKTERDAWMQKAAQKYPEYQFDKHMGYPTAEHLAALEKWGPTPLHRFTFTPLQGRWKRNGLINEITRK